MSLRNGLFLILLVVPTALTLMAGCDNPARSSVKASAGSEQEEDGSEHGEWELVWADEFAYEGLPDSSKWTYEVGGHGWGNQELQYYTARRMENARVEDGHLIIEARRDHWNGHVYTSARLNSKASWTYGRIEVRAKLPSGRGTWPAIWMLPDEQVYGEQYWPDNGEIDIMEHVGYAPDTVHASVHTAAYNHIDDTQRTASTVVPDARTAFNVYAVEWTPSEIRAYVNGDQYFTFTNERLTDPEATYRQWPFDQNFHLVLNIAVGGTWGGAEGVDPSIWPQQLVIDYVRVYSMSNE